MGMSTKQEKHLPRDGCTGARGLGINCGEINATANVCLMDFLQKNGALLRLVSYNDPCENKGNNLLFIKKMNQFFPGSP